MESQEKVIGHVRKQVSGRNSKIAAMQKEIDTLEERIGIQEQYSLKDPIIIDELLNCGENWLLLNNVMHFFDKFMECKLQIADMKACQFLPKSEKQRLPTMAVKFLSFHHEIDIYNRRMVLKCPNMVHPLNKQPI